MFPDSHSFSTTGEFIDYVKNKENVLGILEYGSRECNDMSSGGDYDISIILKESISPNFNGIHFHIGGIPVDCMLLSLSDFEAAYPKSSMLLAHIDSTILYDRDGTLVETIKGISAKWSKIRNVEDWEIAFYRFFFKHTLDKIGTRLYENELFSSYSIALAATILIEAYERVNRLRPGNPRNVLNEMQRKHLVLYRNVQNIFMSREIHEQFVALKLASNIILEEWGGIWQDNEILFHLNYGCINDVLEQRKVINILFG